MPVSITCPGCGLRGQIPETMNTPSLRCPRCNTEVPNPAGGASAPPPPAHASPGPLLDEFFARAYAAATLPPRTGTPPIPPVSASLPPMPAMSPPPVAAPPAMSPSPEPPPPANGAPTGSPKAEEQWIREERQRLEAYMGKHFSLLQQQREEFSKWRTQVEAALVGREQELNRQQKLIAAQNDALQQRTAELAEKEGGLAKQIEEVGSAGAQVLQEVEAEKQKLEQVRKETERMRQVQNALQARFAKEKQAMEAERVAWVQGGSARKELQDSLVRNEAALRRRVSEVMNLEAQIYHELERQEQRLAIERRQIEQTRQDMLAISDEKAALRRKIAALSQELEQLRRAAPPASR